MKKIAFIPARCGSKSIHFKNIKMFCGKPLIYWTLNYFLGAESSSKCHLIDFSRYGFDCLAFAKKNPEAFSNFINSLGIKKNESIIIIDEFTTSGYFLPGTKDLFNLIGYHNARQIDMAHDIALKRLNYWSTNQQEIDKMSDAMEWLGISYNSGRTFKVEIKDKKWQYSYQNWGSSNITMIRKNGQYLGWLNRAILYRYLIKTQPEISVTKKNTDNFNSDVFLQKENTKSIENNKLILNLNRIESAI